MKIQQLAALAGVGACVLVPVQALASAGPGVVGAGRDADAAPVNGKFVEVVPAASPASPGDVQSAAGFPSFDEADANLDGAVSRGEFRRTLSEVEAPESLFDEADDDGSGAISREEWAQWRDRRLGGTDVPSGVAPAAGPADAADDGEAARRHEVEIALTGESLQGRYLRDADLIGLGGNDLALGLLLTDDRDIVASGEVLAPGLLDRVLPDILSLSLGGRAFGALLDSPDDDVFGLAPGAEARFELPFDVLPMAAVGHVFYAPDILTFGDADGVIDFGARFEVQVLERTTGFAGYRILNFERDDEGDDKIVNGVQAGLRFSF